MYVLKYTQVHTDIRFMGSRRWDSGQGSEKEKFRSNSNTGQSPSKQNSVSESFWFPYPENTNLRSKPSDIIHPKILFNSVYLQWITLS